MKRNLVIDVVMAELEKHGICGTLIHGGKHGKVTWESPTGRERWVAVPCSLSDCRAHHRNRAWVRRILREDGITLRGKQ